MLGRDEEHLLICAWRQIIWTAPTRTNLDRQAVVRCRFSTLSRGILRLAVPWNCFFCFCKSGGARPCDMHWTTSKTSETMSSPLTEGPSTILSAPSNPEAANSTGSLLSAYFSFGADSKLAQVDTINSSSFCLQKQERRKQLQRLQELRRYVCQKLKLRCFWDEGYQLCQLMNSKVLNSESSILHLPSNLCNRRKYAQFGWWPLDLSRLLWIWDSLTLSNLRTNSKQQRKQKRDCSAKYPPASLTQKMRLTAICNTVKFHAIYRSSHSHVIFKI